MIHRRKHQIHLMNRLRSNHRRDQQAHHPVTPDGMMNRRRASHHQQLVDGYDHENVQIQIKMKMATNHRQKRNYSERSVQLNL